MGFFTWPYPAAPDRGYWGEITSTIDWCEENYVITPYIAEWSNTITNAVFVLTALYSTYSAYRTGLELRFVLIGIGFALVGVGSWLFHMTLQYHYQLLDELPMLYATCIPTWSMVCEFTRYMSIKNKKDLDTTVPISMKRQWYVGIAVTLVAVILSLIYLITKNVAIHETAYGIFTVLVFLISNVMTNAQIKDKKAKKNLFSCMILGATTFVLGFLFWNLDNQFCNTWIFLRRTYLHLPLGLFFEFHGWWHLLTGTGVYYYIIYLQYQRIIILDQEDTFMLIWRWGIIPELVRKGSKISTSYSTELLGSAVSNHDLKKNN
ncbi:hypothetical protein Kpol_1024p27 [Vanderwaltozyma polyspora DSM 70294]|uniref:Alkaline ceramidase YPC1 n=1 Tax=Vanderwaltozyma polyspora (strain ATCC 22028 / DSM 70294 / BCRC 21397 / CBS 2163 / NBRC 10782 / NRRL Y-8283 / UCD 57-17) TaxID=436907 RepID=A7TLI7_VANPO|nr:uncharacterized protein Kpol_1024p27 [Vanderwaltozyma polyspora DSM 70294]EDO16873.1 hypothetical protein Kpol_1024p27 [Vanderwaltozyma polyspora DSM 70294]